MQDGSKTREQLITELHELRQRPAESEREKAELKETGQAREALGEREKLCHFLLMSLNDGFFAADGQGALIFANEALARIHGFETPGELLGTPFLDLVAPSAREEAARLFSEAVVGGRAPTSIEIPMLRKGGAVVQAEIKPTMVLQKDGTVSTHGIVIDITQRKFGEEAPRLSEEGVRRTAEELSKLMDVAPIPIWVAHDPDCHCITGNRAANSLFDVAEGVNVSATPTGGRKVQQLRFFKDGLELAAENLPMQHATSHGVDVLNEELDVLLPCGRRVTLLGSASPLREDGGSVSGCIAVFMDITERKLVKGDLRKSEEWFRELAEKSHEVFWVRTPDEILYISPAYEEIWGVSLKSLYEDPSSFFAPVHPEDRERTIKSFHDDLEDVAYVSEEFRILRPDGEIRWVWARSFLIREEGILLRTTGLAEDITVRKEAEELLCIEKDLALRLGSSASFTEALELLLEACLKIGHLDCGGIYLVEPEDGALKLVCHQGLTSDFVDQISLYEPTSPQCQFVMKGKPGYWSKPLGIFEMDRLLDKEGLTALSAIPVRSDGEVVALLNVSSHTRGEIPLSVRIALENIAGQIGHIISRVRLGETIKAQSERLEETNAALRVLLRQREHDRAELEESVLDNVKHLVLPYLDKLKRSRLADDQRQLFELLESHLREIISPFVRKISAPLLGLTPTEIRVAELIRQGRTSKEIADLLVTSERAVIFHRQGIRRKLGLIGKHLNLQSYLATLL